LAWPVDAIDNETAHNAAYQAQFCVAMCRRPYHVTATWIANFQDTCDVMLIMMII